MKPRATRVGGARRLLLAPIAQKHGPWPSQARALPEAPRRLLRHSIICPRRHRSRTPRNLKCVSVRRTRPTRSASGAQELRTPAWQILCSVPLLIYCLISHPRRAGRWCLIRNVMTQKARHIKLIVTKKDQAESHCSPAPSRKRGIAIGGYTVQCCKCLRWRIVPTKKKYEEIRERIRQVPFLCGQANEWKPGVTCCDPTDVSQNDRRLWAIDKPSISQPPLGWERIITVRNEGCSKFADVYYIPPTGKTLRSTADVKKYLEQNPQYAAGIHLSQFSFKTPAPLRRDYVRKCPRQSKPLQQEDMHALLQHTFTGMLNGLVVGEASLFLSNKRYLCPVCLRQRRVTRILHTTCSSRTKKPILHLTFPKFIFWVHDVQIRHENNYSRHKFSYVT